MKQHYIIWTDNNGNFKYESFYSQGFAYEFAGQKLTCKFIYICGNILDIDLAAND